MREAVVPAIALLLAAAPLQGQVRSEAQVFGVATGAADPFVGGGLGLGVRGSGRLRLLLSGAVGTAGGALAGRAEAVMTFSLNPMSRRGVVPYAGGGMAAVILGDDLREYLVLLFGVESRPAARAGWFGEIGVGGGLRGSAGIRVRWGRARPRR